MTVHVVGSVNTDRVIRVERHPNPGETIFGESGADALGGKGANQALAARRSGAEVRFVGAVGDDDRGRDARLQLERAGVDVSALMCTIGARTGIAVVAVDNAGENTIIVDSGVNAQFVLDDGWCEPLEPGDVVLCQGELPASVVVAAARSAGERGCRFVLNLAPVIQLPQDVLGMSDPLVLNQHEAAMLGISAEVAGGWAAAVAEAVPHVARSVVVTLGADGAVFADASGVGQVPAGDVVVVDTTGAGDAFTGAVAAALAAGEGLAGAVRAGVAEAGRVVGVMGATPPQQ